MKEFEHRSVLLDEAIKGLCIRSDGIYVDGTMGGGGHSGEIAKRLGDGRLIAIDRDEDAINAATRHLEAFRSKVIIVRDNYSNMSRIVKDNAFSCVHGILLDLGVSSFQLDEEARGFSYMREDAPLDMRMDRRQEVTAAHIINTYSEEALGVILREYGEERFAKRIARGIAATREQRPINTAGELNEIIKNAIPAKYQRTGGHPSKRVYQALRIEVNHELDVLKGNIDEMIDLLADKGRLCIITFHSLEDRIVKQAFRRNEDPCECPKNLPVCVCGKRSKGRVVTRRPILPSENEIRANSRAKSAKLRIFERKRGL